MPESHIVTLRKNFFYPNVIPIYKNKDKNVAISGMQKLECHKNVEISLGMPQIRWWGARTLPPKDKNVYKGETEVEFYHHDPTNIQLAGIKPALTVV